MILREKLHKARTSGVHGFLPQELLSFALPARRTTLTKWKRRNGDLEYIVNANEIKDLEGNAVEELPSGKYARAAMLYLCTQAKLTGDPIITVNESFRSFTRDLGMEWQGAARSKEAIRQLLLVAGATFSVSGDPYVDHSTGEVHARDRRATFSTGWNLWATPDRAEISMHTPSTVTLSDSTMEMMDRAAPLSMQSWRWILTNSKSPMALDVYAWLCARLHRCEGHGRVTWQQLYEQFGSTAPLPRFKQHFRQALDTALTVYPEAQIKEDAGISRTKGFKGYHLAPSPDPRDSKIPNTV